MSPRLDDPALVEREYATGDRLAARRLDFHADFRGDDPWRRALDAVAEVSPRRVLDAGCGVGEFAALIEAEEVVALDSSPALVEEARGRGLDARVGDIQELPFADGEFDAVTCNWVLYHLADLDRGVAELARVLRPGGRLVAIGGSASHLRELWSAVGDPWGEQDDCAAWSAAFAPHFARVEVRPSRGEVVFASREALQAYLDTFAELAGPLRAPEAGYPFHAKRDNCVVIGDKA